MNSTFFNNVKTAVLLGLLTGLILIGGQLIAGQTGLMFAIVMAAVMNIGSYFYSDKIALAASGAQEVGPDHPLYPIVERLAQNAGLPMPRVFVSPQQAPNAFATGRNPAHAAVCATQGLLDMLTPEEIAGVMGHELTHVKNRDILTASIAATIAGAIGMLPYMFWYGGGGRSRRGGEAAAEGLLFMLFAPLMATLMQLAISRSREFNADAGGAQLTGNPMYLATALEKIHLANHRIPMDVNPAFNSLYIAEPMNIGRQIGSLFQSHPPLEKRLMHLIGRESTGLFAHA
jgi:heat shock protein HtpX